MAYCVICGRTHDADLPCIGPAQTLRDIGLEPREHSQRPRDTHPEWQSCVLRLSYVLVGVFVVLVILSALG